MSDDIIKSINEVDNEAIKLEVKMENDENNPEINPSNKNENLIEEINKNNSKIKKRYFGIDLIRVLACFLVMQIHSGQLYPVAEYHPCKQQPDQHRRVLGRHGVLRAPARLKARRVYRHGHHDAAFDRLRRDHAQDHCRRPAGRPVAPLFLAA